MTKNYNHDDACNQLKKLKQTSYVSGSEVGLLQELIEYTGADPKVSCGR